MIDFNIRHYLIEDSDFEYDPNRFDGVFYGEFDDRPETERQLLTLQREYLQTRDKAVWKEMFQICWKYMRSLILQRQRGKGFIEPEIIDDQTTSATLAFMSQYLTRPEFEVGASFAGMMKWKIIEVLYKGKDPKGELVSLQLEVTDNGKATLEDLIAANDRGYSPEDAVSRQAAYEVIQDVLDELDATLDCKNAFYISTIVRLYVLLCFRHPKNRHAKKMFIDKWSKEYNIERLIDYVMLEIRNRLLEEAY